MMRLRTEFSFMEVPLAAPTIVTVSRGAMNMFSRPDVDVSMTVLVMPL